MRRLDELHLKAPFAGSRMLRDLLRADGAEIGCGRAVTLMQRMGIEALYRRPNTSKPALTDGLHLGRAGRDQFGVDLVFLGPQPEFDEPPRCDPRAGDRAHGGQDKDGL